VAPRDGEGLGLALRWVIHIVFLCQVCVSLVWHYDGGDIAVWYISLYQLYPCIGVVIVADAKEPVVFASHGSPNRTVCCQGPCCVFSFDDRLGF
jgi:hypothetical protein